MWWVLPLPVLAGEPVPPEPLHVQQELEALIEVLEQVEAQQHDTGESDTEEPVPAEEATGPESEQEQQQAQP